MEQTRNLGLSYLFNDQIQKEILINHSLSIIDCLINNSIISDKLSSPPQASNGDLYLVAKNGSNQWKECDNKLALYINGWHFITPREGALFWNKESKKLIIFIDNNWHHTNLI